MLPYSRSFSIEFIPNEDERAPRERSHSASITEVPIRRVSSRRSSCGDLQPSHVQSQSANALNNPNSDAGLSASNID